MSKKLTIQEMQEIAKERGGECLSKQYLGLHQKLKWKCKEGHIWDAVPGSVRNNGTWCRKCYFQSKSLSTPSGDDPDLM